MVINGVAVMRRRSDSWLNATQILKVAGVDKGKRTKVLEKEILSGEHEKVQGGYGRYQGTWINYKRGREFCRAYAVEDLLRPLLEYDMGQDGAAPGKGAMETPTKEQAMAAQRKKMMYDGADNRSTMQTPNTTFFQNISLDTVNAVKSMNKAQFGSLKAQFDLLLTHVPGRGNPHKSTTVKKHRLRVAASKVCNLKAVSQWILFRVVARLRSFRILADHRAMGIRSRHGSVRDHPQA